MSNGDTKSPNGITILVLGITGFLCFISGIIAWIMGNKEIKLYPDDSNVKAGRICGIFTTFIGIILAAVYVLIIIFFTKIYFFTESMH